MDIQLESVFTLSYKKGESVRGFSYVSHELIYFYSGRGKIYINDIPYEETYLPDGVYMNSFGPYKVPENAYFVMGDNRTISNDARSWTYKDVTSDEIVARAWFKYYPHWEVF